MNPTTGRFVTPNVVASHFHLREGDTVADFGAGSGYFIPELSKRVGPSGRVYACDIQKGLVEKVGALAREQGLGNIHPLWCDVEEPNGVKIQSGTLDVGVLVNTLFAFEEKVPAIQEIARTLRTGAKLFVIDWTESFGGLGPTPDHVVTADEAKALFESNGFVFESDYESGGHHYGLMFRKL